MPHNLAKEDRCPYSNPPYTEITDDHIFPQFLGGRKTIKVCKQCNNLFGHTFEGRASTHLKRLQVFISHFGLDLTNTAGSWPAALVIGNDTYDLTSGPDGAQYWLNKPTITRDSSGQIIAVRARSQSEASQIIKGLRRSGQAKQFAVALTEAQPIEDVCLTAPFTYNPDLYRLATKMASAVLVAFGQQSFIERSGIPHYLQGEGTCLTSPAYCDIEPVLELRPPLAHTVYVELGKTSYAIVLIFGFLKLFVPLPTSDSTGAFLGVLDPLTGEESFLEVTAIGPRSVPTYIQPHEALLHFQEMNATLTREASGVRQAD